MQHTCSKCNNAFSFFEDRFSGTYKRSFNYAFIDKDPNQKYIGHINVNYYICPNPKCRNIDVLIEGDNYWDNKKMWFHPSSMAKSFEYTEQVILDWYNEAYNVLSSSPRASAMLARSCIQKILRTKIGIVKKTLYDEIKEAETSGKISPIMKQAFDDLREIGNLITHPNDDILDIEITHDEARIILSALEMLILEIYVEPGQKAKAYADLKQLKLSKEIKK